MRPRYPRAPGQCQLARLAAQCGRDVGRRQLVWGKGRRERLCVGTGLQVLLSLGTPDRKHVAHGQLK